MARPCAASAASINDSGSVGWAWIVRSRRLGDEVGRARPDDVGAQQPARLRVGDDLDEAFDLAECQGATRRAERELPDFHRDAFFLRLFLAESHVRDLGVGVDAIWRGVVVGDTVTMPGDVLHRAHAFVRRDVREHDAADHVAYGPDAIGVGVEVLVHHDAVPV